MFGYIANEHPIFSPIKPKFYISMIKTDLLEKRVIARLERTLLLFGYISLEAIVNSHFKHNKNNKDITFKKIYSINKTPILKAPITKQFREMLEQQNNLKKGSASTAKKNLKVLTM
ncbi:hypothetical protein [Photobacterium kishitanii]|uniref:hypothetical protein n=1 Tax=Photobacterium kishitanii TaxID=318456 RepID=UPI0007F8E84A|nr:hypothetical protein [Photobacterium kishitanii]OBU31418.1 hypothetical protein AYY23_19335 [Photobacterium kishitanii]